MVRKKLEKMIKQLPDEELAAIYWAAIDVKERYDYKKTLTKKGVTIADYEGDASYTELIARWESTFANISTEMKNQIHYSSYKWHVFSYGKMPHLTGKEAIEAFNKVSKKDIYYFYQGENYIEVFKNAKKLKAKDVKHEEDIYLFDETFTWAFIRTHEGDLGPYFVQVEG